jgi:hypothetical protein
LGRLGRLAAGRFAPVVLRDGAAQHSASSKPMNRITSSSASIRPGPCP